MGSFASAEASLRALFRLTRLFRDAGQTATERVEALFGMLFGRSREDRVVLALDDLREWSEDSLTNALGLGEELVAQYVKAFSDPRNLPVTYYKRERVIRRFLDKQLSGLLKELARRTRGPMEATLILEEPIYYLTQKYRERSFPKPRSEFAALEVLKSRFHSDLTQHFGRDPFSGNPRRVLLPHEIR